MNQKDCICSTLLLHLKKEKINIMITRLSIIFITTFFAIFYCSSPNEPAKKGFTAKEAEQLASTRALEIWDNPVLVSMEVPENGGGVNRQGRLAEGEDGKWWFRYFSPGFQSGLLIEVISTKTYNFSVPIESLLSLQEILPGYIDSSDALAIAEINGGKDLTEVKIILCKLLGDPIWPKSNPTKVAWEIIYKLKNGSTIRYYIEGYDGIYLGKG